MKEFYQIQRNLITSRPVVYKKHMTAVARIAHFNQKINNKKFIAKLSSIDTIKWL